MNIHMSPGDTRLCQIWDAYVKGDIAQTQIHGENVILILLPKVKVMTICDTMSYGDTLMCQTYDYVKDKKLWP